MMRWVTAVVPVLALTLLVSTTWAERNLHAELQQQVAVNQSDEPSAPDGEEPSEEPGGQPSEEPGGQPSEEPGGGEPAASPEEPAAPTVAAAAAPLVSYGGGIQFRGIFVPTWFLDLFLDASTGLSSVALGGEFVRRKGNFDLIASINFGFYSPDDGNFLGNGDPPGEDTDYVQFRDLNLLAFDVAFIWHHEFTPWLSLVYGAGLGMGIVLGDIYRISNYRGNCTPDNVNDISTCNPVAPNDTTGLARWRDNPDQWLADAPKCSGNDSPSNPCQYREDDVWPVVPIVHLLVGVNFKINEQFSVRVDGGFHNAFYFGTAGHYFF